MKEQELKTLQTVIFLLDGGNVLVLENDLLPYLKKAQEIKEIINS